MMWCSRTATQCSAVRSKNISEDRKHQQQVHRHQLHQVKWQELTEDCEGKLGHIEAELNEEPEERAEFEKQVEELRQEEAGKAGLEERKREREDRVERLIGVVKEEKGKSEEGQTMMAELEDILRV
ncbi:hypothetical protein HPB47_025773 [Ixodes persulcatus]|uniref:Uncharacterized protein n=1 Tax=Ixodes persulcatus TaxID=34615 RepID=A0AC60Q1M9_IXOPE|nr:hypothetical protein HPB47_025773 [Ixodes persulcatus]